MEDGAIISATTGCADRGILTTMATPPSVIGPYRVLRLLGEGGMGAVYEGVHQTIERRVAIKLLHPEYAHNRETTERFLNEARAVNRIGHPGIVQVTDHGLLPDGSAYIVMELLSGETLAHRIASVHGKMPVGEVLSLGVQIASALAAAHEKGIVHRDVKPQNIMMVSDPQMPTGERIKLLDFGLAKVSREGAGGLLKTSSNAVLGTPLYMSPEQCAGAGKVDARTDVYSLGCVMYEMLSGSPVFRAEGAGQVLGMHMFKEPEPLRHRVSGLPPQVARLVHKLLTKERNHRPSMDRVVNEIEKLSRQFPPSASAPAHGTMGDRNVDGAVLQNSTLGDGVAQASAPFRQRFIMVGILGLMGLIAGSVGSVALIKKRPKPQSLAATAEKAVTPARVEPVASSRTTPGPMIQIPGNSAIKSFWLDAMEVTVNSYQDCVTAGLCAASGPEKYCNAARAGRGSHPINCVSYQDAKTFCAWTHKRLPSESEWELAAGGTEHRTYPWGSDSPDSQLCWNRNEQQGTCPVGSFVAGSTPEGARDLAGNVWEWVTNHCPGGHEVNSEPCHEAEESAIARGGAWVEQKPEMVRVASREATLGSNTRWGTVGFRCASDSAALSAAPDDGETQRLAGTPFRPKLIKLPPLPQTSDGKSARILLVAETEVTQGQYKRTMNVNPSEQFVDSEGKSKPCRARGVGDELPVFCVGFIDALRYANTLSRLERLPQCFEEQVSGRWVSVPRCTGYRLPTGPEWEYAARAGTKTKFSGSDALDEVAWWKGNSHGKVHPVRSKRPNPYGLYDMTGNVFEWTVDAGDESPGAGLTPGNRIVRGGSFFMSADDQLIPASVDHPILSISTGVGFRLVRSVE